MNTGIDFPHLLTMSAFAHSSQSFELCSLMSPAAVNAMNVHAKPMSRTFGDIIFGFRALRKWVRLMHSTARPRAEDAATKKEAEDSKM